MFLFSRHTRSASAAGEHPNKVEVVRAPFFLRCEVENFLNIIEEFLREERLVLAFVEIAALERIFEASCVVGVPKHPVDHAERDLLALACCEVNLLIEPLL